ncbi:MAG: hypothetical protein ACRBCT_03505 [Alphaproteobacteria bacterium]
MTTATLPHIKPNAKPSVMPKASLADAFNMRAALSPSPALVVAGKAAERSFAETRRVNDQIRTANEADARAHERYQVFEAKLEKSYVSRGLSDALDQMSFGNRKGIIAFSAKAHEIHEVADQARSDLQEIADRNIEEASAKFDAIIARLG